MKAYLAWPVKLHSDFTLPAKPLHITLKYIGPVEHLDSMIDDISQRLQGSVCSFPLSVGETKLSWSPEKFNPKTCVMAFRDYDPQLDLTEAAVSSLAKNPYAHWRPHLTLPAPLWRQLLKNKTTPEKVIKEIGPLLLFVKEDGGDYKPSVAWL
jgi:2'-5' RNA ligase